jgi:hypothetical protein
MTDQPTLDELRAVLQITPPMGRGKCRFLADFFAQHPPDGAGYALVDAKGDDAPFLADLRADFVPDQGGSVVLDITGDDVGLLTGVQTEGHQNG